MGPDSQRPVHGPCELKCCERTPEDKTYDIYLARGRVQGEGLRCGTMGSWDSGAKIEERSMIWDDREESNGKAYVVGQREAGTQVYRSGTDSVVRGHWTSYLQMVCGTIKVYVLYVYSTEPVLSAELC